MKRPFSEPLEGSDSEQEFQIVEELSRWENKLKIIRQRKLKGGDTLLQKNKMAKLDPSYEDELLSNPSTSRGRGNSWFESDEPDLDNDVLSDEERWFYFLSDIFTQVTSRV